MGRKVHGSRNQLITNLGHRMTTICLNPRLAQSQKKEIDRLIRCGYISLEQFQKEHYVTFDELAEFGYMHEMEVWLLSTSRLRIGPNGARFIKEVGYGGSTLFRDYLVKPHCSDTFAREVRLKRHLKRMQKRSERADFRSLGNLSILYSRK